MLLMILLFGMFIHIITLIGIYEKIKKKKRIKTNGLVVPVKLEDIYYEKTFSNTGKRIYKSRFIMKYHNGSRLVTKLVEYEDNFETYQFATEDVEKKITINKDNPDDFEFGDITNDNFKAEKILFSIILSFLIFLILAIIFIIIKKLY